MAPLGGWRVMGENRERWALAVAAVRRAEHAGLRRKILRHYLLLNLLRSRMSQSPSHAGVDCAVFSKRIDRNGLRS